MMKIDYNNMTVGDSEVKFAIRYFLCCFRTWYQFHIKWPWVRYNGFVRVMKGCGFAKFDIQIGHNVQFGDYSNVAAPVHFGNNILCAARVCFVGKHDHTYDTPGITIWNGKRIMSKPSIIEDDVWLGHGVTVVGPVNIGKGSIVAAGAVVTKDIGECEIWGGVPAKKIANRFKTEEEKNKHMMFLNSIKE